MQTSTVLALTRTLNYAHAHVDAIYPNNDDGLKLDQISGTPLHNMYMIKRRGKVDLFLTFLYL